MLKKRVKQLICGFLYYSQLLHVYLFVQQYLHGPHPLVLYYHRVLHPSKDNEYDCSHRAMVVKTDTFLKQIEFLMKWYQVISIDEYLQLKTVPKNVCIVTFDDGWVDNYTRAFPILTQYKCPAAIYLSTKFIGGNDVFWQENVIFQLGLIQQHGALENFLLSNKCAPILRGLLAHDNEVAIFSGGIIVDQIIETLMGIEDMKRKEITQDIELYVVEAGYTIPLRRWVMNWSEIREMIDKGISFGSHTKSHEILTRIPLDQATEEIVESKTIIEKELKREIDIFAFPNGDFNEDLLKTVEQAGYRCALMTEPGKSETKNTCVTLRRVGIHEGMSTGAHGTFSESIFACSIAEIFSGFGTSQKGKKVHEER